ncbi:hypothetical protein C1645_831990 [Glomus cerebriforme]|uniref:Uncharacterized protein n=1 Tax=Glomus cerebriforme TaxID=658196 RepID=A0A397SF55_9GLOM|nr:hypothetical protein C1645_831990 [Glomus cerebriforme]
MNANPNQRPTASELKYIFDFWYDSICSFISEFPKCFVPNLSESGPVRPNIGLLLPLLTAFPPHCVYLYFPLRHNSNLFDPQDCQDSQLVNLEVSSTLQ